jgi:putative membrane protein
MESENANIPWQRVHPISLLFLVIAKLRQWIIPLVFGLFSARQGNLLVIGMGVVAFAILLGFSIARYLTLRFRLVGGELQVRDGIFFRSSRTVPVNRIQNIDLVQNVLHRIFGVAEVRIETASGKEPEAVLRVLTLADVERLRTSVFAQSNAIAGGANRLVADTSTANHDGLAVEPLPLERPQQLLLAITLTQLALAGLTSNRGLLLVPIALGTLYEARGMTGGIGNQLRISSNDIFNRLPHEVSTPLIVVGFLAGCIVLFALLKLFSIAWFVIRFYGYQLWAVGDDLRIGCGLMTKVSATIPRSRIQFISIHRSWLGRRLGLAAIRIETAGGGGAEHENASQSVARRWFVPVISETQVVGLLERLRPGIQWTESQFDWQPLSPRAGKRLQRLGILATVVLTLVAGLVWQPWGAAIGIMLLPMFLWLARRQANAMRYARCGSLVVYRSGLLTRKCSCAFLDKIQTVRLSESPFDRRWQMATLAVDTAAAGPAEHRILVKYLDVIVAQREYASLKAAVA